MAKICLCLTAKTIAADLEILARNRSCIDIAELRVDCLAPDERFLIRNFPEQAGLPVILTIRREKDGGNFAEGEASRIRLLAQGLAFAQADRRKNFAYVDLEEDLNVPSLEEAARTFGTRIIRSAHCFNGVGGDMPGKLRSLRRTGDEIAKIAVQARGTADALALVRAAREARDMDKIFLCMGHYGVFTRILTEKLGSQISYTSADEEGVPQAAPGQLCPRDLAELYRFRGIGPETKVFGVLGHPLRVTNSPKFFNTVFALEAANAVYVPFPTDSLKDFMALADELGLSGVSVTVPYKEAILDYLGSMSEDVGRIGACNTISRGPRGWEGTNTDMRGFSDSLLAFIGALAGGQGAETARPRRIGFPAARKPAGPPSNLKGRKVTVIGAGGAARAVAAELYRLGARALILNRTPAKARNLAAPYKFRWGGLNERGMDQMERFSDIIIQTTPAGMEGDPGRDPLETYPFSGKEIVMDLVYQPDRTPFLRRAEAASCPVLNGYDMFIRQARYQYTQFFKRDFPADLLARVNI
ncbi:MAG: type I 3-dehydroquinate dehydratase [Treponema sp.]|jgi:3-dehydroquinate dehydratase/shikimate dehydrogenase|nr:type I 3-dehydroquinate dehydratase [Treponema sp.]